jgi:hypothetical protein
MKLLLQWSLASPQGWVEVDSAQWASLPKKPLPVGGEVIDDTPGWIHQVNVQGVCLTADHYAVEEIAAGEIRVTAWNEDEADYPEGWKYAHVWTFRNLAPDPNFGGAINTRQTHLIYAQPLMQARLDAIGQTGSLPWADFVAPAADQTKHGVWVENALNLQHDGLRDCCGWYEWTEGVDPKYLDADGCICDQRSIGLYNKPKGTKTYYGSNTALATGVHAVSGGANEYELSPSTGVAANVISANLGGNDSALVFAFTTPSTQPADAAWPTGTYRCQLDVISIGTDISYGLRTAGTALGHFARVNAALLLDLETKAMVEALFTGTGLKLATTGSVSWLGGATTDRYECLVAATRPASHGNQNITLEVNEADDFADGPWVPPLIVKSVAETEAIAEATSKKLSLVRQKADTEEISETTRAAQAKRRQTAETEEIGEQVVAVMAKVRSAAETEAISEGTAKKLALVRTKADTEEISEATTPALAIRRTVAETEEISETTAAALGFAREQSDTEEVSEATAKKLALSRQVAETEQVLEATATAQAKTRQAAEVEQIVEQAAAALSLKRSSAETEEIAEATTPALTLRRAVAETEEISETTHIRIQTTEAVAEAVEIGEQAAVARSLVRIVDEAVLVFEGGDAQMTMTRAVNEAVDVDEEVARIRAIRHHVSDTVAIPETEARRGRLNRQAADLVEVPESLALPRVLRRTVNETEELDEDLVRARQLVRRIDETEEIDESRIAQSPTLLVRTVSESVGIFEEASEGQDLVRVGADAVAVLEEAVPSKRTPPAGSPRGGVSTSTPPSVAPGGVNVVGRPSVRNQDVRKL